MDIPPLLLQTAGSLIAILALAGLAWWLKLGGAPVLVGDSDIRRVAGEVEDGFEPLDWAVSQDHTAALARDAEGRIMLIRLHGNRFAGRILGAKAGAQAAGDTLTVGCGETWFGKTRLIIANPNPWAEAINRISEPCHA
ncbi:MAG: hypothetical protein U1D66_07590 [Erythrobacter sp.]|nr:hypothetical protein [Erythrobacter sp.]